MKTNKLQLHNLGFTLIETIVAIAILTMVITGPLSLSAQSLKAASAAKNNFLAANLAQEGIELIRFYRTNNMLRCSSNCDTAWLNGIINGPPGNCQSGNGCYIAANNFVLNQCSGGVYPSGCPLLKIDPANNFYNYTSGTDSIFQRTIKLITINSDTVRVQVTITWAGNGGIQSLTVEEIMLNWLRP